MQSDSIQVVLLSGGSGTRLWPLSNAARSKQFLKVLRDDAGRPESMVCRSIRLLRERCPEARITVATSASQVDALELQVEGEYGLSLEPERRDTAPAIMLAASHVAFEQGGSPDSVVVVMPIDTYADPAYYESVNRLAEAVRSDVADLVLLGVAPTESSSKYGYIVPKADEGDVLAVQRFVEKPAPDLASDLIEHGALWNCGVFAFRLGYLLDIVSQYVQVASYADLRARYKELPKISFDYEVVEKATSVAAIRYEGAWKDLGTWGALCEELCEPISGNAWLDDETCEDVHAINECNVPLVVAGVSHVAVVATPDGILVAGKDHDANVRELVNRAALSVPGYERKRWGSYTMLQPDVRELVVDEGCELQPCASKGRAVLWTVAEGTAKIELDGETREVGPGEVVRIEAGMTSVVHACSRLRIIEVCCKQSVGE